MFGERQLTSKGDAQYSFFGRQDELVVLVAERLEGGPVNSRVSAFSAWWRVKE